MILKVYTNQVQLKDDEDKLMARVEFVANEEGVCRIGDVIKETEISPKVENKMMSLALQKVRKNGQKVVPTTAFAQTWFNNHPEDRDLMAEGADSYISQSTAPAQAEDDIKLTVKQQEPASLAPSQEEVKKVVKKGGHKVFRGIARLLQLVCAICMAAIIYFFVTNAVANLGFIQVMITSAGTDHKIFLGGMVAFVLFCVIEFIWIMTRKKIKTEDEVDYIDSGRGMIAFILILVAYFAALFAFGTFGKTGVYQWIPHFITPLMYVPYISGIGALLCIIRKIIGK